MALDLPEDMNRLIASYVKPKSYSEMSVWELTRMIHEIKSVIEEKEKINKDDTSDKYMVIRAEYVPNERFFKIDKTKYSNDLSDYHMGYRSLYYKGEEIEVEIYEQEGDYCTRKFEWYDFDAVSSLFEDSEEEEEEEEEEE